VPLITHLSADAAEFIAKVVARNCPRAVLTSIVMFSTSCVGPTEGRRVADTYCLATVLPRGRRWRRTSGR
jgi:hypothetical protein